MNTRDLRESELYRRRFGEKQSSWGWLIVVAFCCILAVFGVRYYFTSHYGGVVVDGASMDKTLADGQQLLMEYVDELNMQYGGKPATEGKGVTWVIDNKITPHMLRHPYVKHTTKNIS